MVDRVVESGYDVLTRNPTGGDGFITITGATPNVEDFGGYPQEQVDIFTTANDLYVEFSLDGTTYLAGKVVLMGSINQAWSPPLRGIRKVRFSNVDTGGTKNAKYQVVGARQLRASLV